MKPKPFDAHLLYIFKPRRVPLLVIATLMMSLSLGGCQLFSNGTPPPSQATTPTAQSQANPADSQASGGNQAGTQPPVPGMPSCGPCPDASGTPSGGSAEPVVQPSQSVPPFVVYSGGKLADSWSDASWSTKADLKSTELTHDGKPTIK